MYNDFCCRLSVSRVTRLRFKAPLAPLIKLDYVLGLTRTTQKGTSRDMEFRYSTSLILLYEEEAVDTCGNATTWRSTFTFAFHALGRLRFPHEPLIHGTFLGKSCRRSWVYSRPRLIL